MVGAVVALLLYRLRPRKAAGWLVAVCAVWLWIWSMPVVGRLVGVSLEAPYLIDGHVPAVESYPQADLIELHGGGMGYATEMSPRGEMYSSADRVWMAARLWKAGKAPMISVTGAGAPDATIGLLEDFGVPTNVLVCVDGARNTEEEARIVAETAKAGREKGERPKVLVVTSAWHMNRTLLMYEKYAPGVEAIPAPCDFENSLGARQPFSLPNLLPDAGALMWNSIAVHEWVGFWGYKLFR